MNKQAQHESQLSPRQNAGENDAFLLVRSDARICAIPVAHVVETLRPRPAKPVAGIPEYVDGVSIIRGKTMPVVRLAALLGAKRTAAPGRLVVIRVDGRQLAVGVDTVIGVSPLEAAAVGGMPPLLKEASPELVAGLGRLDQELLFVLQASHMLPAEVWNSLEARQQTRP